MEWWGGGRAPGSYMKGDGCGHMKVILCFRESPKIQNLSSVSSRSLLDNSIPGTFLYLLIKLWIVRKNLSLSPRCGKFVS